MPASFNEWSDQHWDRTFARQTSQMDTVKLLVAFALGISATIVATTLQVEPQSGLDLSASIPLGLGFAMPVAVIALDTLEWPSRTKALLMKNKRPAWEDDDLLEYVRDLSEEYADQNEKRVRRVKRLAEYQLLLSAAAAILAIVSLFQPAP